MKRIITLWALLGAAYVALETLWRGYSHPSMFIVGGLCGVLVGALNQAPRFYSAPGCPTGGSRGGGCAGRGVRFRVLLNLWLGLGVWDYSELPGNVLGQICPAFGLLWFLLMPFAIWAEDTARWCIWFYEMSLMPPGEADVKTPLPALYSLKSIYSDFIKGK